MLYGKNIHLFDVDVFMTLNQLLLTYYWVITQLGESKFLRFLPTSEMRYSLLKLLQWFKTEKNLTITWFMKLGQVLVMCLLEYVHKTKFYWIFYQIWCLRTSNCIYESYIITIMKFGFYAVSKSSREDGRWPDFCEYKALMVIQPVHLLQSSLNFMMWLWILIWFSVCGNLIV